MMLTEANAALAKSMPELGRLKAAAERVSIARSQIENFLARFNGPTPEQGASANETVADTYRNDLESLFFQIDSLENAVGALVSIG